MPDRRELQPPADSLLDEHEFERACRHGISLGDCAPCLRSSLRFTRDWYAERIARLTQLAKDRGIWPDVACILANGTASADEPPTYGQLLNTERHRANRMRLAAGAALDAFWEGDPDELLRRMDALRDTLGVVR